MFTINEQQDLAEMFDRIIMLCPVDEQEFEEVVVGRLISAEDFSKVKIYMESFA